MLSSIVQALTPTPKLRVVPLGASEAQVAEIFADVHREEVPSEYKDTVEFLYETDRTKYFVTFQGGAVVSFTVNSFHYSSRAFLRRKKLQFFLDAYRGDSTWDFFTDNGFSLMWRRRGDLAMCNYSYECDVVHVHLPDLERNVA
jgi:hypothetical protein